MSGSEPRLLRVALDHNFPEPLLSAVSPFIIEAELLPIRRIHDRMPELEDEQLVIELDRRDIPVLVTNNYKMLKNPRELAAIMATRLTVVGLRGMGHDPVRATGALLLDLPVILKRVDVTKPQVVFVNPRDPRPSDPWELMTKLATRNDTTAKELYNSVKLTPEEIERDYLDDEP